MCVCVCVCVCVCMCVTRPLLIKYGCTTWNLTKCLGEKLDVNDTRMLNVILNSYWKEQPYGCLLLISKIIQVRGTRHTGHC